MAKKQKRKRIADFEDSDDPQFTSLQKETVSVIYAVMFFVISLFLILSVVGKAGNAGRVDAVAIVVHHFPHIVKAGAFVKAGNQTRQTTIARNRA